MIKKKKVIVHCAPCGVGTGANLGMLTVDFAIHNILKEYNLSKTVEIWSPWSAYNDSSEGKYLSKKDNFNLKHHYGFDMHKMLNDGDSILFWGDFQWGNDYQVQSSIRLIQQNIGYSRDNALYETANRFMLRNHFRNNTNLDIMTYGTTLFQNRLQDYQETTYRENLEWLIKNASFIKFRDPYSAMVCETIKEEYNENFLGLDAALLNTKQELLGLPTCDFSNQFVNKIGFYFGRSTSAFPKYQVLRFMNQLSSQLGKKLINIPWSYFAGKGLFSTPFDRILRFFGNSVPLDDTSDFKTGDIIGALSKCSLIITDTYHVAINAIALGIPVVMIPEFRPKRMRDANMGYVESWRDKRVLLFQSNFLNDLMVLPDLLKNKTYRKKKIALIQAIVENEKEVAQLYNPIHKKAKAERKVLGQSLRERIN